MQKVAGATSAFALTKKLLLLEVLFNQNNFLALKALNPKTPNSNQQ